MGLSDKKQMQTLGREHLCRRSTQARRSFLWAPWRVVGTVSSGQNGLDSHHTERGAWAGKPRGTDAVRPALGTQVMAAPGAKPWRGWMAQEDMQEGIGRRCGALALVASGQWVSHTAQCGQVASVWPGPKHQLAAGLSWREQPNPSAETRALPAGLHGPRS